jgi:hypothetical protein
LIANEFVLVDLFVDYKKDNVVVEQPKQLVDIVIVVVNVVLKKTKQKSSILNLKNQIKIYVVDIEINFDLNLAYYNVLMVVVSYYYFVDYFLNFLD